MNEHIENVLQATLQEINDATDDIGSDVEETARTVATLSRGIDLLVSHGKMPAPTTPEPEGVQPSIEGQDDSVSLEEEEESMPEPEPEPEVDLPETEEEDPVEEDEFFEKDDGVTEETEEDDSDDPVIDVDSTKDEEDEPVTAEEAEDELDELWSQIEES